MSGQHLYGLEGTNPLGFFAALGVQVAFLSDDSQPRLWWSEDITPHAIVDDQYSVDRIVTRALRVFSEWKDSPAVNPMRPDGSKMPKGDALKLKPDDLRRYIECAMSHEDGSALATSLVAEGSLDKQGVTKPSDFYFTAGQQKFLDMARKVLSAAKADDIAAGIEGPWRYDCSLPSLGWDVTDDRVYALRANDPSPETKLTNPGPEALGILGLSLMPVFASPGRTLTQGCSGSWKSGKFSWPLWRKPATPSVVRSLVAQAYDCGDFSSRQRWFRSWGVSTVLKSPIRRSDQGGYGTFGPAEVVWQDARLE